MSKIKAVQFLINTGPHMGGVEQCASSYSKINDLSSKVEIISIIPSKEVSYKKYISGKVYEVNIKNKLIFFFKIFCIILKERPGFFIFHSSRALKLVRFLSLFFKIKIIGVNHGFNLKKFINKADIIFCINSHQVNITRELLKNSSTKVALVANFTQVEKINRVKKIGDEVVIGTLSRIDFEYKNLDKVVESAVILKKNGVKFKIHIGGDFGEIDRLKEMVSKNDLGREFVFKGLVVNKKEFFDEIDIFCMPSKNETFGISYIEAMANQIPVIATDNDGAKDIFENKVTGVIINKGDPDKIPQLIADSVTFLVNNPEKRQEIIANAYKVAQEKYSFEAMKEVLEGIMLD